MFSHFFWFGFFELLLEENDVFHESSELFGLTIIIVLRVFGHYFVIFALDMKFVDSKALAGCLGGTDSAVVHIFLFNMNDVFCFFASVILVCAVKLSLSLAGWRRVLLEKLLFRWHCWLLMNRLVQLSRGTNRTDHRLSSLIDFVR